MYASIHLWPLTSPPLDILYPLISLRKLEQDDEYVLFNVTVFKKVRDEFVQKCRENKWVSFFLQFSIRSIPDWPGQETSIESILGDSDLTLVLLPALCSSSGSTWENSLGTINSLKSKSRNWKMPEPQRRSYGWVYAHFWAIQITETNCSHVATFPLSTWPLYRRRNYFVSRAPAFPKPIKVWLILK